MRVLLICADKRMFNSSLRRLLCFDVCCFGNLRVIRCSAARCFALILRVNGQTNYNGTFLEAVVSLRTAMPFLGCSNVDFSYSFEKIILSNCHKQESHNNWNLFFMQCTTTRIRSAEGQFDR